MVDTQALGSVDLPGSVTTLVRMKNKIRNRNRVSEASINAAPVISYPMSNLVKETMDSSCLLSLQDCCLDLDIENLAFEGGGNKGLAYIGALKVCYCCIVSIFEINLRIPYIAMFSAIC